MGTQEDRRANYAVELHHGAERTVIAIGSPPLAPIAAELEARGAEGDLVIVRRGTGDLVIVWPLAPAKNTPTTLNLLFDPPHVANV